MVIVSAARASIHCWNSTAGPSDERRREASRETGTAPPRRATRYPRATCSRRSPRVIAGRPGACNRHTRRDPASASGARPSHRPRTLPISLSTMTGILTPSEPQYKPDCEGSRSRTAEPAGRGAHPMCVRRRPSGRFPFDSGRRVPVPNVLTTRSAPERPSRRGPGDRGRSRRSAMIVHPSKCQIVPVCENGQMPGHGHRWATRWGHEHGPEDRGTHQHRTPA